MGNSRFTETSYNTYDSRVVSRAADPILRSSNSYTADVRAGRAARRTHQTLDPQGLRVREARDSATNPNSLAIAVFFDVTGSMGSIPVVLRNKLKTLMRLLTERGYVADPQVLFGGIGDVTCDAAPLQIGQFESDIQMDDDLDHLFLEGGGGGQVHESYELAYYFAARHTACDCWERRQHKGYLFTIGDEHAYDTVVPTRVAGLFGATANLPQQMPTVDLLREAEQRWNVFHILADTHTSRHHPEVGRHWHELLGERVLPLADPEVVAELVALVIGLGEGQVDIDAGTDHLRAMGVSAASIEAITQAVTPFAWAIRVRAEAATS